MDKIKELKNDRGTFKWLMEFIKISEKYEFQCKHEITIDAYNKCVCVLDQLAEKYNLHDKEEREHNVWYEHYYLWPKMEKFFDEECVDYMFEKALDELWWYSDMEDPMSDFCQFMEKFANDVKGYTKAKVINLSDFDFRTVDLYIAYEGPDGDAIVLQGGDFVKHIQNTMDTLDNEYKEIWSKEIFKIIKKYK